MSKKLVEYGACKWLKLKIWELTCTRNLIKCKQGSDEKSQKNPEANFKPTDVDAGWLTHILSSIFTDKTEEMELQVMEILSVDDARRCENRLFMSLGF